MISFHEVRTEFFIPFEKIISIVMLPSVHYEFVRNLKWEIRHYAKVIFFSLINEEKLIITFSFAMETFFNVRIIVLVYILKSMQKWCVC